jgi:hypothetical protein
MRMIALLVLAVFGTAAASFSTADAQSGPGRGPAPSLTAPRSPAKAAAADGFVQRWLVLEPIPMKGQLTDRRRSGRG